MTPRRESGSAMVIALLVAFILSLLGVSFLMMAQTESRIAHNERLKAQAFFGAEAGVRAVKSWFDRPTLDPLVPTPAQVDRTQRRILDVTDPYGPTAGLATTPIYREGTGPDPGDPLDDTLFERPYRGSDGLAFMGRAEFPDLVIDIDGSDAEGDFLRQLSATLLGPVEPSPPFRTRIAHVDVYAPPYLQVGSSWARYGIATIGVTARVYEVDEAGNDREIVAEQRVAIVLNELPYATPVFGPMHTCRDLTVTGRLNVHWGTITVAENATLPTNIADIAASVPRQVPPGPRLERLFNSSDAGAIASYESACDGQPAGDPWLRLVAGADLGGPPPINPGDQQPWSQSSPSSPPPCTDRSNLVQRHPLVGCPEYDYDFWKAVASSGGRNVHYYVWEAGDTFKLNGVGDAFSFQDITFNKQGLFFFDTSDRRPPRDDDGDGIYDNLTDTIEVSGIWNAGGFIYLNAQKLTLLDVAPGQARAIRAPGEIELTIGGTDVRLDLDYPTSLAGDFALGPAASAGPDERGPAIPTTVDFEGILFTKGSLEALGTGRYYGSMIAQGLPAAGLSFRGISLGDGSHAVPDFYWNATIGVDWPPPHLTLPRVAITRWTVR